MSERARILPALARQAIESTLGVGELHRPDEDWLQELAATFVTLEKRDELRGCIGSIEPTRSLLDDVVENARAAAFRDPRFPPVTAAELSTISIEVSVLSPLSELQVDSEEELLETLQPERHGLVLNLGHRRATFLPSVWEQLPSPADFVRHLKLKAGIPADYWSDEIELQTYEVARYGEPGR